MKTLDKILRPTEEDRAWSNREIKKFIHCSDGTKIPAEVDWSIIKHTREMKRVARGKNYQRVKVVDAYPGSGKTSWAIEYMNTHQERQQFIYITPFLDECQRIVDFCDAKFVQPEYGRNRSKLDHITELIEKGYNIASTHSLFRKFDSHIRKLLATRNYTLIIDESLGVVDNIEISDYKKKSELISKNDLNVLLDLGLVTVGKDGTLATDSMFKGFDSHRDFTELVSRKELYFDTSSLVWTFPVNIFTEGLFKKVYLLTYQFEYQIQAWYYKSHGVQYDKYDVVMVNGNYEIVKNRGEQTDRAFREMFRQLVNIYDKDNLNAIGDPGRLENKRMIDNALSKQWYHRHPEKHKQITNNIVNYFNNIVKSVGNTRIWTCFKDNKNTIKSKELSVKNWLPVNCRATNEFGDRTALAYPVNRYLNPSMIRFFHNKDVEIDSDGFALAELIQWIMRSAIRNGKSVNLYIPSHRMRHLLLDWIDGKI